MAVPTTRMLLLGAVSLFEPVNGGAVRAGRVVGHLDVLQGERA
jgi:hypothetical protein